MPSLRALLLSLVVAVLAVGSATAAENAPTTSNELTRVKIATHSDLNDATALVNKNTVMSGNNVAITRSNVLAQQSDMLGDAEAQGQDAMQQHGEEEDEPTGEADQLPWAMSLTGERDTLMSPDATEQFYGYRHRFFHRRFRGGYYGWRYPLSYWNLYGRRFYGGYCPFGRIYGGYYFC